MALAGAISVAMWACSCATPNPGVGAVATTERPLVAPPLAAVSAKPPAQPAASELPSAADSVVIVAGGDVSFGREAGQRVVQSPTYSPFGAIWPFFSQADLRFVNLESQLSEQQGETQSPRHRLIFTGPPAAARTLAEAGIHVV